MFTLYLITLFAQQVTPSFEHAEVIRKFTIANRNEVYEISIRWKQQHLTNFEGNGNIEFNIYETQKASPQKKKIVSVKTSLGYDVTPYDIQVVECKDPLSSSNKNVFIVVQNTPRHILAPTCIWRIDNETLFPYLILQVVNADYSAITKGLVVEELPAKYLDEEDLKILKIESDADMNLFRNWTYSYLNKCFVPSEWRIKK